MPARAHLPELVLQVLHALQVGQLIIVPGVSERETATFVEAVLADPMQVRREGGFRARLVRAGVERIAVIEVSLRSSAEVGLAGLDLLTAPLEEIADEAIAHTPSIEHVVVLRRTENSTWFLLTPDFAALPEHQFLPSVVR